MKRVFLLLGVLFCILSAMTADPVFNKPHGLYANSFALNIKGENEGAVIRYTTDGSEPTVQSKLYTGPFIVSKTQCVRAAEFKEGERCSDVVSVSYIFPSAVARQTSTPSGYPTEWGKFCTIEGMAPADYGMDPELTSSPVFVQKVVDGLYSLPILSITTDRENLFNKENNETTGGIYIYTGCPVGDGTGRGWERPASIELFGGEQEYDLSVDCALKLHGGHSRLPEKNPKHSFRLTFKSDYGPSKLNYAVYGDGYVEKFNSLVVRTFFGDSWTIQENYNYQGQYIRDMWMRMMQKKMGYPYSEGLYVHTFINGLYWGIYNLSERIDDNYCKIHFGGKKSDYDVIKQEGALLASEGNFQKWNELISLSSKAEQISNYNRIIGAGEYEPLLDVDNFIDYMLLNFYVGNVDWDYHNWFAVRNRERKDAGFIFVSWDGETIFYNAKENVLNVKNYGCPTGLFHNLMNNNTFKHRFIDRAYLMLSEDGLLTEKPVVTLWDSLYSVISDALYDESARWGDYRRDVHPYYRKGELFTVENHYMKERERLLKSYFPIRTAELIRQLKEKEWYARTEPPVFMINGEEVVGDTLYSNQILMLQGGNNIFYTTDGSDPVSWTTTSMGKPGSAATEYRKGNNILADINKEGWVTFRTICQSIQGWSPTVERSFYIKLETSGGLPIIDFVQTSDVYDLSGRKVSPIPQLPKGIYIINGKKVARK